MDFENSTIRNKLEEDLIRNDEKITVMTKPHFDFESFKQLMSELDSNSEKINALEKDNKKIQHCILEKIQKATLDWEPVLNEKAVVVRPTTRNAWYVWYAGNDYGHRFKEVPAGIPGFNHFYRLEKEDQPEGEWYIVPLEFFLELQKMVSFHVFPEKHR
jgi:hypothetical protein